MQGYKDVLGNEICKGDTLLYYTTSGSSCYDNQAVVIAFENDKVVMLREGSNRKVRISRYEYAVVLNEIDRAKHVANPGLKKLWDKYVTFKAMST